MIMTQYDFLMPSTKLVPALANLLEARIERSSAGDGAGWEFANALVKQLAHRIATGQGTLDAKTGRVY